MQLVAYGAQDIYLTGNPQITFFKVVYRRHTNFAVESIEQTFNGSVDFGRRVTATISRNGDLIQQMYLEVVLPTAGSGSNYWTYGVGNAMVKTAEIEIGGQLIDRHYGEWMNIWTELSTPAGKRDGYDDMVGNVPSGSGQDCNLLTSTSWRLYVPFQFWFNRNPGLALPLIALQYHEVKLNLELRPEASLTAEGVATGGNSSFKLYVDYVYLDTDERRRFAQVSHEYLIEQVQFTGDETVAVGTSRKNFTLNFNHPVKELVWVHITSQHATQGNYPNNKWLHFGIDDSTDPTVVNDDTFTTALLQLNGHDRFSVRNADYFRKVQNLDHHSRVPRTPMVDHRSTCDYFKQYIYCYSFALSPEEHQPSGTCNFSRIDNAVLQLSYNSGSGGQTHSLSLNLKVFAVNYNVLRIMSGMGGLAYSN